MLPRRDFLTAAAALTLAFLGPKMGSAFAQGTDKATSFVKATGDQLIGVVNGPGSAREKRAKLTQIINTAVDVDSVARFCLGRYWRQATAQQQKQFVDIFHEVLVTNITSKLGEYQGVRLTVGRSRQQEDEVVVSSVVERPNNPPTNVDWVISNPTTTPRIIDVVAEGTSLRLTQRSDYASYLSHNGNNIDALIAAMRQQVSQG